MNIRPGRGFLVTEGMVQNWDQARQRAEFQSGPELDRFQQTENPLQTPGYYPGLRAIELQTKMSKLQPEACEDLLRCGLRVTGDTLLGAPGAVLTLLEKDGLLTATLLQDGVTKELHVSKPDFLEGGSRVFLNSQRPLDVSRVDGQSVKLSSGLYDELGVDVTARSQPGQEKVTLSQLDVHAVDWSVPWQPLRSTLTMATDEQNVPYVSICEDGAERIQDWSPWGLKSWRYVDGHRNLVQKEELALDAFHMFGVAQQVMSKVEEHRK